MRQIEKLLFKFTVLILLFYTSLCCAQENNDEFIWHYEGGVVLKLDLPGVHTLSGPGGTDRFKTEYISGISVGYEGYFRFVDREEDYGEIGFGIEYFMPHHISDKTLDGSFAFMPLYLLAEYHMLNNPGFSAGVYLGHNLLFTGDSDYTAGYSTSPGIFYGFGLGKIYDNIEFEIRYCYYYGELKDNSTGQITDVTHKCYSALVTFRF